MVVGQHNPLPPFTHPMSLDDNFGRVAPESYNRLKHPSLKQFHDFVSWLRESTVSELEPTRGDMAATKDVFIRFFERGLRADLLFSELMEILPSVVIRADYAEPERSEVVAMLKQLSPGDLGIKRDEKGL
jgi:hypothetical protein